MESLFVLRSLALVAASLLAIPASGEVSVAASAGKLGADLYLCASFDGGRVATYTSTGDPVWWGLHGGVEPFKYQIAGVEFAVHGGWPPKGNCIYAGAYPVGGKGLAIAETFPRADGGTGISAFIAENATVVASDAAARSVTVRLRKGANYVTFAHQHMCDIGSNGSDPPSVRGLCQEGRDGISTITFLQADNFSVALDSYTAGTKDGVWWEVTKVNPFEQARCRIEVVSTSGVKATFYFDY